jgi:hypothetical protein
MKKLKPAQCGQYDAQATTLSRGQQTRKQTPRSVKLVATTSGDTVYDATGRAFTLKSKPSPKGAFVTEVGSLKGGLVFTLNGSMPLRAASVVHCKKGQEIVWWRKS